MKENENRVYMCGNTAWMLYNLLRWKSRSAKHRLNNWEELGHNKVPIDCMELNKDMVILDHVSYDQNIKRIPAVIVNI